MSCFRLPTVIHRLNMHMARLWGNQGTARPIHWVSWISLTVSKFDGGLAFCSLEHLNKALLAKQGWFLLTDPRSQAPIRLKGKYFPHSSFLSATLSPRPS
ncbi:Uncharacterized mitochondrial protein AtMg00310 [Linum grandiflorum]